MIRGSKNAKITASHSLTEPCGCSVSYVINNGFQVNAVCSLHGNAELMYKVLKGVAEDPCCQLPGCTVDTPVCHAREAQAVIRVVNSVEVPFNAYEWSDRWGRDTRIFNAEHTVPVRLYNALLRIGEVRTRLFTGRDGWIDTPPVTKTFYKRGTYGYPYPEFEEAVVHIASGDIKAWNIGNRYQGVLQDILE